MALFLPNQRKEAGGKWCCRPLALKNLLKGIWARADQSFMDLGVSGLASGFDWRALIDQISNVERLPQRRLQLEQRDLRNVNNSLESLETQLKVTQNRVTTLNDSTLYESRKVSSSDSSVGTATAAAGTPVGSYAFDISKFATASVQTGSSDIGATLSATNDVSGLALSDAGFAAPVTAGTITVNGQQVDIATSDTLQDVFDNISTATGGAVTGSYDSATDTISLASGGEIVLGSATDTSNFLQTTKLYNNCTGAITSNSKLGAVDVTEKLDSSNFSTAIDDGGSGEGEFKINGVSINFSAEDDTMADVISRINDSAAGVTASYDSENDRMVLTNDKTGDMGIALEDVTGNFLTATGTSGGTLSRGDNLEYSINNGPTRISQSNVITSASSGISGLSVTALQTGTFTVDVANDTEKVKTAINSFVEEYNRLQSQIATETASSTDADGKVTAGILANQSDVSEISDRFRSIVNGQISGLDAVMNQLDDLGITTNGTDDKISVSDTEKFDEALQDNLPGIRDMFLDETNGIAVRLADYLERTVGEEGSLITRQDNLSTQIADIDDSIAGLERTVQSNKERMVGQFIQMEIAQQQANQQLSFLAQRFSG